MMPFNLETIADTWNEAVAFYKMNQAFITAGFCLAMCALLGISIGRAAHYYKERKTYHHNRSEL